jgi:glycosyltransferase involved in cell wall biosynthesis
MERGHRVSVVTAFPSYPFGRVYDGYRARPRATTKEMGARVTRVFNVPYQGSEKERRVLSYFSFAACAFLLGLLPRRKPDVIYAYHPPLTTGLVAALYSLIRGVPFVYDVQDLWPDAIAAAGFISQGSLVYKVMRLLESFIYKRAGIVTVITEGMRNNLLAKGVPARKIRVISNWGDPDVYRPMEATDTRRELGWEGRFVVMLAGNMGLTHGLETVLEAASELQCDPHILFVFLGSGAARQGLKDMAKARQLHNVVFHDEVPQAEAAKLINAADIMLVHLKDVSGGEFSMPHRIFSYMLCGKATIAAAKGSTADLIMSEQCGWTCPPSDARALAGAIRAAAENPLVCRERGSRGLQLAKNSFSRAKLLARIESAIRLGARSYRKGY